MPEIGMAPDGHEPEARLPVLALLALATTGFVTILTETVPAGLLPGIARGLDVSEISAGQLVTSYAMGSLIAAVPLVAVTLGWRRRRVLLLAVGGLLAFNTVTALSGNYLVTLAARLLAGVFAGLGWGVIAGYARRLVVPELQGKALALAMVGTPIALALGVPAGTLLGSLAGWRATFVTLSVLTVVLIVWIRFGVPDAPGQPAAPGSSIWSVFGRPGLPSVMLVIFLWMLGHNALYTYIAPFVSQAGLGRRIDLVLLLFGAAALVGIWATGRLVESRLRVCVLASLAAFALVGVALSGGIRSPPVVLVSIAIWGLTFGGASTLLNTASADAAGDGADIVLAMVTTVWNFAIAAGGIVGGFVLSAEGPHALPELLFVAALLALAVAWHARGHGFPPGPRKTGSGVASCADAGAKSRAQDDRQAVRSAKRGRTEVHISGETSVRADVSEKEVT